MNDNNSLDLRTLPSGVSRRDLLKAAIGAAAFAGMANLTGGAAAYGAVGDTPTARSRIVAINGCPTLLVDDIPFLITGSQIDMRSVFRNDDTVSFFDALAAMNATTIGITIPWASVEVAEGRYDFSGVDWFIQQAELRGLKILFNLSNTNICGKVQEDSDARAFIFYAPAYIRSAPDSYQRVVFSQGLLPQSGAPPMCPNDPRTLARERAYVEKVAEYLHERDAGLTVLMLQLENSANYSGWMAPGPKARESERCRCRYCDEKWAAGSYSNGQMFMCASFAAYVEQLAKAITAIHPVPIYVNNWPGDATRTILDTAPHISLVSGCVLDPHEPNGLSEICVGRNVPFASEAWTHMPSTRLYIDALPFYTLVKRPGLGLTLWDPGGDKSIIYDGDLVAKYSDALYPIKHAQSLIAKHRGTDRFAAWCAIRDPKWESASKTIVVEGGAVRTVSGDEIAVAVGNLLASVSCSTSGYAVQPKPGELYLCLSSGRVTLRGLRVASASAGRFEGDRWIESTPTHVEVQKGAAIIDAPDPVVIRVVTS